MHLGRGWRAPTRDLGIVGVAWHEVELAGAERGANKAWGATGQGPFARGGEPEAHVCMWGEEKDRVVRAAFGWIWL